MEWPRFAVKPGNTKLRALFRIAYGTTRSVCGFFEAVATDKRESRVARYVARWMERNIHRLSSDDFYEIRTR